MYYKSMVSITYFVHGTTTDNESGVSSGWSDAELSPLGIQQSKDLIGLIQDKHFDAIFTSDLSRAKESAQISFPDVPRYADERLRECNYGDYNGKPSDIVEPMQERCIIERFPNGESYEDVRARMESFLQMLKEKYDGKSVAIVAHKAPQLALDVILRSKTWGEAFAEDWRKYKAWKFGWDYLLP